MSAVTGVAPLMQIPVTVGNAVRSVVITSSPGPIPQAIRAIAIASVPLATPTAKPAPRNAASSDSNAETSGPRM